MKNKQKESMLQIKSKLSLKPKYKGLFVILLFYVPLLSICKTELYTIVAHLQKLKQTFTLSLPLFLAIITSSNEIIK